MSNNVIASLPPAVTGDGLFTVNPVVPTADADEEAGTGLFAPSIEAPSTSYSYPLMDPAKLIGTGSQPYMNVALPAYISTLYTNVFKTNTNLKNTISTAAVDNREYPTSYAVQQYVQTQIAGTQVINGSNNTYHVNTTMANTLIQAANTASAGFSYVDGSAIKQISLFWMDTGANAPRNGASKTVMFSVSEYLTTEGEISGNLAFLYAGDSSHFLHLGVLYKYYQFVCRGDFLDFIQSYNSTTSSWEWLVKDSLGVFSDSVTIASGISDNAGSNMPLPSIGLTLTA